MENEMGDNVSDGFNNFIKSHRFYNIPVQDGTMLYNSLYQAYINGYKDSTIDSVDQLKVRMEEFNNDDKS
jgi:hypothetical protein